jgi:hypothetical protein
VAGFIEHLYTQLNKDAKLVLTSPTSGGRSVGRYSSHADSSHGVFLYTQLGATSNYNAIADLHTLQITTAQATSSQSVFTSRFLVTDLNNGDSSASVFTPLPAG